MQVNVLEAKADFSKLIRLLDSQREERIVVARAGKPVVQITLYKKPPVSKRIGVAKNRFKESVCQAKMLDSLLYYVYNAHVEQKGMGVTEWQQMTLTTVSVSAACTKPTGRC